MTPTWNTIFDAVGKFSATIHEARRLTNLLIAAILVADPDDDEETIGSRAQTLMLAPEFRFAPSTAGWARVVDIAIEALSRDAREGIDIDAWVLAFQRADPARKNLGAYATPSSFAKAIAEVALPKTARAAPLRIVDPACGAGALLIACLDRLHPKQGSARRRAALNLHGMELDPAARELACLHIWLAGGAHDEDFARIARNIRCGNALVHDWSQETYDVLVMNPPWESLRHKASDEAQAIERTRTLDRINEARPASIGLPPLYSAQGSGDRNLCKGFLELAPHLLAKGGRIGALIPAAFGSDDGMQALRRLYLDHFALDNWTGFENRAKAFDIDTRYKFGIISGARCPGGTSAIGLRAFATLPEETRAPHVVVDRERLAAIGGPVGIIPDITSPAELAVLTTMLTSGTPFFAESELGRVRYRREVDLSLGRRKGLFERIGRSGHSWNDDGTMRVDGGGRFVPVLEGRMVGQFDFFQKSWVQGQGRTAIWRENGQAPLGECRPQFIARPIEQTSHRLAICDVTSATNTRTVHATVVPDGWVCGNTAPVLTFESEDAMYAGLAVLNSLTFDWLARRMVSGLHLNKFYLSCMAWPILGSAEVGKLADAGRALAAVAPRRPLQLDPQRNASFCRTTMRAETEHVIAKGYGLDAASLGFMLDHDPNDRRGFWRHYEADAENLRVARLSSHLLSAE